jgi:hypothetical protein
MVALQLQEMNLSGGLPSTYKVNSYVSREKVRKDRGLIPARRSGAECRSFGAGKSGVLRRTEPFDKELIEEWSGADYSFECAAA